MRAARPTGQGHRVDLRDRHLYRGGLRRISRVANVRRAIRMVQRFRGAGHRSNHGRAQTRLDNNWAVVRNDHELLIAGAGR